MKIMTAPLALLALLCSAPSFADRTLLDLSVDVNRQTNIDGQDTDTNNRELELRLGNYRSLGNGLSVAFYGGAYTKTQSIDNDANYWQLKTGAKIAKRISSGFDQSTVSLTTNYSWRDYSNDVFDQSQTLETQLGLNSRLTDTLSIKAQVVHRYFEDMYPEWVAAHWQSIDAHDNELQLNLSYQKQRLGLRIEQRYTEGDRFIAAPYGARLQTRVWPDSTIHTSLAGLHYALNNNSAIDLQANHYRISFRNRNYYSNGISLAYLYRFEL